MAIQWGRIKTAYLKGDMSLAELAKKYKVGASTIKKHASNEGWKKEKDQINTEVSQAIHARAKESKEKQLEELMTATDQLCDALVNITHLVKEKPALLLGPKGDAKAADSISRALLTAIQCKRDLHKLPTLDQDMRKKEEAQRKREAKARMEIEREKLQLQKDRNSDDTDSVVWTIEVPEGSGAIDE